MSFLLGKQRKKKKEATKSLKIDFVVIKPHSEREQTNDPRKKERKGERRNNKKRAKITHLGLPHQPFLKF